MNVSKAKVPTPSEFGKGASTAVGATNTETNTQPTNGLKVNPNNFRNLRNAKRSYVGEAAPSIPVNGSVGTPPR
jgi:hypothetical protein